MKSYITAIESDVMEIKPGINDVKKLASYHFYWLLGAIIARAGLIARGSGWV